MTMFDVTYMTCTINLLFFDELEHSIGYFVWMILSAVFLFG